MKTISLITTLTLFVCFTSLSVGQNVDEILQSIADNNPYLVAERKHTEMKSLEYRTGLTPSNPTVSYGYFPGNKEAPGNKTTLDVMQSFDFPTTYIHKKHLAGNQIEKIMLKEESVRQDILFQAKQVLLQLIYLQRMNKELTFRSSMAEKLHSDFGKKLNKGSGTIVEMNRAKLELVSASNRLQRNEAEINQKMESLYQMNGGKQVMVDHIDYSLQDLIPYDSLLAYSLDNTARIRMLVSDKKLAEQNLKLQKALVMPTFEVGYGSEMVADEAFRGGRFGISIPLWEDKSRIKSAKAYADYTESNAERVLSEFKSKLRQDYLLAESLKANLDELRVLLATLNNHEILKRSLTAGQISSIEYFTEVAYYYELMDQYLLLELDYQIVLARLYKHEL